VPADPALAESFDLKRLPDAFYDDPYPTYRALREHAPVKRMADGSVFLSRYADVVAVYKDSGVFSSDKHEEFAPKYGSSPLFEHHTTSLVFNDPPLHTRVRRLIAGALTPRHIAAMEARLVDRVDHLLDAMAARGSGAEIDLIAAFASAIPVEIIGNLLDVPGEERAPLRDWSLAILGALEPTLTQAQLERGNRAVREFLLYLADLVERRRATPGDPEIDVLSRLIGGEGGEALSATELLHNCIFLLNAGHETTTNLIGNGMHALLTQRDQWQRLVADPALLHGAVEELLRYESPLQLNNRLTTAPMTFGDTTIEAGQFITLGIGAANRDPAQFPDPDRLDISRRPNLHLAFGHGMHACAGMNVARLEARIAIGALAKRFPDLQLRGSAERDRRVRFRGFKRLPVVLR
jgi:cytochrome P450